MPRENPYMALLDKPDVPKASPKTANPKVQSKNPYLALLDKDDSQPVPPKPKAVKSVAETLGLPDPSFKAPASKPRPNPIKPPTLIEEFEEQERVRKPILEAARKETRNQVRQKIQTREEYDRTHVQRTGSVSIPTGGAEDRQIEYVKRKDGYVARINGKHVQAKNLQDLRSAIEREIRTITPEKLAFSQGEAEERSRFETTGRVDPSRQAKMQGEAKAAFIATRGFDPDKEPVRALQVEAEEFGRKVADFTRPVVKPVGEALANTIPAYAVARGLEAVPEGTGGEAINSLVAGAIGAPAELGAELNVLTAAAQGKASANDIAGAVANIAIKTGLLDPIHTLRILRGGGQVFKSKDEASRFLQSLDKLDLEPNQKAAASQFARENPKVKLETFEPKSDPAYVTGETPKLAKAAQEKGIESYVGENWRQRTEGLINALTAEIEKAGTSSAQRVKKAKMNKLRAQLRNSLTEGKPHPGIQDELADMWRRSGEVSVPKEAAEVVPPPKIAKPKANPEAKPEMSDVSDISERTPTPPKVAPDDPNVTGLSMSARNAEAKRLGTNEAESIPGLTNQEAFEAAQKRVADGEDPEAILAKLVEGKRPATQDEIAGFQVKRQQYISELNRLKNALDAGDETVRAQYAELLEKIGRFDADLDIVKGEGGRSLNALKIGSTIDEGDFAQVVAEIQRRGGNVSKLGQRQLDSLTKKISAQEKRIAELEQAAKAKAADAEVKAATKGSRMSKEEIDSEFEELWKEVVQKTAKLSAGVDPSVLPVVGRIAINRAKRLGLALEEAVQATIDYFKGQGYDVTREQVIDGIAQASTRSPRTVSDAEKSLAKLKAEAKKFAQYYREGTAIPTKEAKRFAEIKEQIADLEQQLSSGVFKAKETVDRVRSKQLQAAQDELELLRRQVRARIRDASISASRKAIKNAAGLVRGAQLGGDVGTLTRQGLFAWSRPKTAVKAILKGVQAATGEGKALRIEKEITEREINGVRMSPIRRKAGLSLTDSDLNPEETIFGNWLRRLPVFGKLAGTFDRFQSTFINTVRADLFDSAFAKGLDEAELKNRASFINSVTGRGNIKEVPERLAMVLTSPRYEVSRWETLAKTVSEPVKLVGSTAKSLAAGKGLSGIDKGTLANVQDLVVTAGEVYGLFRLAEAAGYEVDFNPTSSDFLKMRRGDEVWDVSAGLAPRLRDVIRLVAYSSDPDYGKTGGDVIKGMLTRALSPAVKLPWEQGSFTAQRHRGVAEEDLESPISGYEAGDEETGFWRATPLILQSIKRELEKEDGDPLGFWWREFIGGSVNRYPSP